MRQFHRASPWVGILHLTMAHGSFRQEQKDTPFQRDHESWKIEKPSLHQGSDLTSAKTSLFAITVFWEHHRIVTIIIDHTNND